jgi:putative peptide zinc metalloprotease protein
LTSRSRTSDARSNTGTGGAADGSPLAGSRAQNGARAKHADGARPTNGAPPRLADGIELIGEYEDSGYKDPPSIARRADGQIIQLPEILFVVAEAIDGRRGYDEIAKITTEASGRGVSSENVEFLIDEKLRPLGVVAAPDGTSPQVKKADPLLALRFRVKVVPDRVVHRITSVFYPFFYAPVVVAALAAFVAVDIWLFLFHGIAQSARALVYNPVLLFMLLGLVILATALHEIGHATAARFGGAKPGVMGAGIYVVWPAFYTDVTDAYRLSRSGRLRTDLGGVYFNSLFALGTAGVYFLTGFEPLLILVLIQNFQILQQMLPFLRLDGYYILSDLTGVPDLFARIRPTLVSALPWRKADDRVTALKPWVRATVTGWVLFLVPVLLLTFGMMLINAPRIFGTAWDSFFVHLHKADDSFGAGNTAAGALAGLQMIILTLPALGFVYSSTRAGGKVFGGAWRWSEGSPMRRLSVLGTTAAFLAVLGFIWWPNGDYQPIQPGERGTVQGGVAQLSQVQTGRPALTKERQHQLGGAPAQSDRSRNDTGGQRPSGQTGTAETTTSPGTTSQDSGTTSQESGTTNSGTTTQAPTTTGAATTTAP